MVALVEPTTGNVLIELHDNKPITIGREASCDIVVASHLVSRQHARIFFVDGVWAVEDLGSRNGTWLNQEHIQKNKPALKHGDVLSVGAWQARVVAHEATLTAMRVPSPRTAHVLQLDADKREVRLRGVLLQPALSEPQFALLQVLVQADGGWVSREKCFRHIWRDAKGGDLNEALDGVVKRLRTRLKETDEAIADAIEQRRGVGLRWKE